MNREFLLSHFSLVNAILDLPRILARNISLYGFYAAEFLYLYTMFLKSTFQYIMPTSQRSLIRTILITKFQISEKRNFVSLTRVESNIY